MRTSAAGILLGASLMAALGACAVHPADRRETTAAPPAEPVRPRAPRIGTGYWAGGGEGEEVVTIKLDRQTAEFRKGGNLVGVSPVTSGREGYETPPGRFRITQKSPDHRSNLYGDYVDAEGNVVAENVDVRDSDPPPGTEFRGAPMPHFLRFNGAIGIHGGYLPGYPASHGCVRLPPEIARRLYEDVEIGTPVIVE